jgi:hypothetical protein
VTSWFPPYATSFSNSVDETAPTYRLFSCAACATARIVCRCGSPVNRLCQERKPSVPKNLRFAQMFVIALIENYVVS